MKKIEVGVLGATGTVGQRFVQLLENHPWFKVTVVTGSERTVGAVCGHPQRLARSGRAARLFCPADRRGAGARAALCRRGACRCDERLRPPHGRVRTVANSGDQSHPY